MQRNRLEAFSDGVIAIIITIMVLELKVPHEVGIDALAPLAPILLCYVLSFVYVGIYWNNHHHMLHTVRIVTGPILWANLHLLFWLSLIPFATAWMGEHNFAPWPVALYGACLMFSGVAYYILAHALIRHHGPISKLAKALGADFKGKISVGIYVIGIGLAFVNPAISCALYASVAIMWLIPDRRIEKALAE